MKDRIKPKSDAALYLHFPCFDGVVSAVLASEYLEGSLGWKIARFTPVNYDAAKTWRDMRPGCDFAVVDFLYHPGALFWADHHVTTFQDASDKLALTQPSGRHLYYDADCPSCSLLLWNNLHKEFADSARLHEMVYWANKIDSATYESVDEALFGGSPAMDISFSLAIEKSEQYCDFLVRNLRAKSVSEVANLPQVRQAAETAKQQIKIGLDVVAHRIAVHNDIVTCEIQQPDGGTVSRYSPYYFAPHAKYSVMLVHSGDSAKITAMRNPWSEFQSVPLGRIFEGFGGGGHTRVASVLLQGRAAADSRSVLDQIVHRISTEDNSQPAKASYA